MQRTGAFRIVTVLGVAALWLVHGTLLLPSAGAATVAPPAVTALAVRPLSPVHPVTGSDARVHLAYELQIANTSSKSVTLDSVDVVDPGRNDAVLTTIGPDLLETTLRVDGIGPGAAVLPPGVGAFLFVDVSLAPKARLPRALQHHFTYQLSDPTPLEFTGVPEKVVHDTPVVVAPPLRGQGWIAGNGCCASITAHRGATLPIDGTIHVPERYAIDFVQLDRRDDLFEGPIDQNSSYPYFGDPVYSVAPGRIVEIQNALPEQTPGGLPAGITVGTAGGNHIVVDIGHGHFAFYAHLEPGSIKVKQGQRVKTGQVLGRLGNTGNSDGAHLHFHIMDGPSPLLSNGLPFEFTSFKGQGVVENIGAVQEGTVASINDSIDAGPHTDALPLNNEVISFNG